MPLGYSPGSSLGLPAFGVNPLSKNLFLKTFISGLTTTYYISTIYNIKQIEYLALFQSTSQKFKPLQYGVDFTYSENKIIFLTAENYIPSKTVEDISITIRYIHAPEFHVIDLPRDTIQTILKGDNQATSLPIHGIMRRSHYVLNRDSYDNTRLVDNSIDFVYENLNPAKDEC